MSKISWSGKDAGLGRAVSEVKRNQGRLPWRFVGTRVREFPLEPYLARLARSGVRLVLNDELALGRWWCAG